MGTFTSPNPRTPYLPPLDTGDGSPSASRSTLLGGDPPASNDWISALARQRQSGAGRDPNFVPAADPGLSPAGNDGQIAQAPESAPARDRSGVAPSVEPPSNSPELEQGFQNWDGQMVRLPDGRRIPNTYSRSGYLMSPYADRSDVAAAGRKARSDTIALLGNSSVAAGMNLYSAMKAYIAHGGTFDYQRRRYQFGKDGFTQLRQFRDVSNFNVGLFSQQAGLSLESTLWLAGRYAGKNSSNAMPGEPGGLDPRTREYIELGHKIGQSGAYDSSDGR